MRFGAIHAQNGGLPVKLAPKVFDFTMDTLARREALSESLQRTQLRAKSAKYDLKPKDFCKPKFYHETEGVLIRRVVR